MIAIYARYSSDLQNDRSIEDQVVVCQELIKKQNLEENYSSKIRIHEDRAQSGSSMRGRDGVLNLTEAIEQGKVKCVVTEGLDRLSRDQEDIARFYKISRYHNVDIITSLEGPIGRLNIGLNGTLSSIQLDQMADRVRRGQAGNIREGKAAGGLSYGYLVKYVNDEGKPEGGLREINLEQSKVIKRIYAEYIAGKSASQIAHGLNKDNIPSPRNQKWGSSTITGHSNRGNGILQNPIYKGIAVWNRNNHQKHPITGVRHLRLNNSDDWITNYNPDLQIISDEDFELVQKLMAKRRQPNFNIANQNQPYPDIGIKLTCGRCGSNMNKKGKKQWICGVWKRSRSCDQGSSLHTDKICKALYQHIQTNFDKMWHDWQSSLVEKSQQDLENRQNISLTRSFLVPPPVILDDISKEMFYQLAEKTDDSIDFVQSIFGTAEVGIDHSGKTVIGKTTPDLDALTKL